jgi:pimeloyl-ACP methyl ester carboxylesterase
VRHCLDESPADSRQRRTAPRSPGAAPGAGDPVVLVHGITESAGSFDPITARLATTPRGDHPRPARPRRFGAGADTYGLGAMAGDVAVVCAGAGVTRPHLVGHSLGGAVVTAAGSVLDVASVVDIDQSLQLDTFKAQLVAAEPMLRDPDQYRARRRCDVRDDDGRAPPRRRASPHQRRCVEPTRRSSLGVWELLLTQPVEEIAATVDAALAGYDGRDVPYLAVVRYSIRAMATPTG